ncbi:hypothetical protein CPB84DRAFT_1943916 [Gymnopilus junonius]|uniref:Uncharacterized protein n=1 Tax=Gymnopilus junonius TaxID=109634 RepID=A0A9P5TJQ0_GYMJU|nr:hypothetical protein CPB84DRAFT_1943916 [Gymnopilus junonius]
MAQDSSIPLPFPTSAQVDDVSYPSTTNSNSAEVISGPTTEIEIVAAPSNPTATETPVSPFATVDKAIMESVASSLAPKISAKQLPGLPDSPSQLSMQTLMPTRRGPLYNDEPRLVWPDATRSMGSLPTSKSLTFFASARNHLLRLLSPAASAKKAKATPALNNAPYASSPSHSCTPESNTPMVGQPSTEDLKIMIKQTKGLDDVTREASERARVLSMTPVEDDEPES